MAQISFDAIPEEVNNGGSNFTNNVEFFNLRNDGDEAVVRIMHDNTASFNIFTVHDNISVGGKRRKVNCIRDPKAPTTDCPLCASGNGITNRIFINMLQYFADAQGQIIAKPVVWERSLVYATKLKTLIDEYGPLSECIFKIKRSGAAGSMETTYEIMYCNPKVYRDELYPITADAFKDYSALGTIILNKNFQDLSTFVATGSFPAAPAQAAAAPAEAPVMAPPPATAYQPKADVPPFDTGVAPAAVPSVPMAAAAPATVAPAVPMPTTMPSAPTAGTPGRPSPRYY